MKPSFIPRVSYEAKAAVVPALRSHYGRPAMSLRSFFVVHCANHALRGESLVAVGAFNFAVSRGVVFG